MEKKPIYSDRIIFMDFLYGKEVVDCSNNLFKKYFVEPGAVTPAKLMFHATVIADDMSTLDGIRFMKLCLAIASYTMNGK